MARIIRLLAGLAGLALLAAVWGPITPAGADEEAGPIVVCTTGTRTLAHAQYSVLRGALLDPGNFGPAGVVERPVELVTVPVLTPMALADCDVLFAGEPGSLSSSSVNAIVGANAAGMDLLLEADTVAGRTAANAVLAALGSSAEFTDTGCANDPAGGTMAPSPTSVTDGPFGAIAGASFATSVGSVAVAEDVAPVVRCGDAVARFVAEPGSFGPSSGLVMAGGDPGGLDFFTSPTSSLYNANNLVVYLNAIAPKAPAMPTEASECKKGGWERYGVFANQGDCVAFVATGGENEPGTGAAGPKSSRSN